MTVSVCDASTRMWQQKRDKGRDGCCEASDGMEHGPMEYSRVMTLL